MIMKVKQISGHEAPDPPQLPRLLRPDRVGEISPAASQVLYGTLQTAEDAEVSDRCYETLYFLQIKQKELLSGNAIVIQQANNRTYAAQLVLKKILKGLKGS